MAETDVCMIQEGLISRVHSSRQHTCHSDVQWCRPCIDTDRSLDHITSHSYSAVQSAHSHTLYAYKHMQIRLEQTLYINHSFIHWPIQRKRLVHFWGVGQQIKKSLILSFSPLVLLLPCPFSLTSTSPKSLCPIHTADADATKLLCRVGVGGVNRIRN